jgi:hypothetical protein
MKRHYCTRYHRVPATREPEAPTSRAVRSARERWEREESAQALEDLGFALVYPFWREEVPTE